MGKMNSEVGLLDRLARAVLREWDLDDASIKLHAHRENAVYRVESGDGEVYALRILRKDYHDLAALESEYLWTQDLIDAGISVPEAVPTVAGGAYATVGVPGRDEIRHAGLVRWIDGQTLFEYLLEHDEPSEITGVYERLGQLIADFHDNTSAWTIPEGFQRHAWDADGLVGQQPVWGRFWDVAVASNDDRSRLVQIRDQLKRILAMLPDEPDVFGMIHADLNADNVLLQDNDLHVIDFDDAGFGWYAFDLAVAVWDQMDAIRQGSGFATAYSALLSGYQSRRGESAEIVSQVPLFLLIRTLMLVGWMEDRPEAGYTEMIPSLIELALVQATGLGLLMSRSERSLKV